MRQKCNTTNNSDSAEQAERTDGRVRAREYESGFSAVATVVCMLGGLKADLAVALEVEVETIDQWLREHTGFRQSFVAGTREANEYVTRSLYRRACGYSYNETKVFIYRGRKIYADCPKHVPADIQAAIFWLKRPASVNLADTNAASELAELHRQLVKMRQKPSRS